MLGIEKQVLFLIALYCRSILDLKRFSPEKLYLLVTRGLRVSKTQLIIMLFDDILSKGCLLYVAYVQFH